MKKSVRNATAAPQNDVKKYFYSALTAKKGGFFLYHSTMWINMWKWFMELQDVCIEVEVCWLGIAELGFNAPYLLKSSLFNSELKDERTLNFPPI